MLSDGVKVQCDAVVIAIGVTPNKGLVDGTGIKANRGILTDSHMETSVPGIYAAGDVAEAADMLSGEKKVTPIWPNAYLQGRYAGFAMCGSDKKFPGSIPMNSIEFYGIPTVSIGIANPPETGFEVLARLDLKKKLYRKLVFRDGILEGAVLVGFIERSGILSGLIRNRINIGEIKQELLKDNFGFADLPAETRRELLAANV